MKVPESEGLPVPDRPEIVCICGSTRFADEMARANRDLTFAGAIVHAPARADIGIHPRRLEDADEIADFLREADLTLSGLDDPNVRLWIERDAHGVIIGTTGYELSADGAHALIRSVAVVSAHRARGRGSELARFALDRAVDEGATAAWLFSRRSGSFWQSFGFAPADRDALARALPDTHQVRDRSRGTRPLNGRDARDHGIRNTRRSSGANTCSSSQR